MDTKAQSGRDLIKESVGQNSRPLCYRASSYVDALLLIRLYISIKCTQLNYGIFVVKQM